MAPETTRGPARPRLALRFGRVPAGSMSAQLEIVAAIVGGAALVGLLFFPLEWLVPFLGGCSFHDSTGFPCGSCGLTRGVLLLAEGRVLSALRMNPLFMSAIVGLVAYAPLAAGLALARCPRPRLYLEGRFARAAIVLALALAFLANWAFLVLDGR